MRSAKEVADEFEKSTLDNILQRAYAEGFRAGIEKAADEALEHCCPMGHRPSIDLPHLCARDIARAIRALRSEKEEEK